MVDFKRPDFSISKAEAGVVRLEFSKLKSQVGLTDMEFATVSVLSDTYEDILYYILSLHSTFKKS